MTRSVHNPHSGEIALSEWSKSILARDNQLKKVAKDLLGLLPRTPSLILEPFSYILREGFEQVLERPVVA